MYKEAEINLTKEVVYVDDGTYKPNSWDTYNNLLGDKPFNDERSHYYFYSKLYRKPSSLDNYTGTFAEHRANMNMRDHSKTSGMGIKNMVSVACNRLYGKR